MRLSITHLNATVAATTATPVAARRRVDAGRPVAFPFFAFIPGGRTPQA